MVSCRFSLKPIQWLVSFFGWDWLGKLFNKPFGFNELVGSTVCQVWVQGMGYPDASNPIFQFLHFLYISSYLHLISSGWWFGTFFIFPFSWQFNHPIWLSYFSGLKWNHQLVIIIPIFDDSIPTFPAKRGPRHVWSGNRRPVRSFRAAGRDQRGPGGLWTPLPRPHGPMDFV